MSELGDGPIEDKYRQAMSDIAIVLDQLFNQGAKGQDRQTGFVLLVFPFRGHGGRCNYISNGADRRDIVKLFKEQIARFEGESPQEADGQQSARIALLEQALAKSLSLQSHYATILNDYDGGTRLTFATRDEWLERLAKVESP